MGDEKLKPYTVSSVLKAAYKGIMIVWLQYVEGILGSKNTRLKVDPIEWTNFSKTHATTKKEQQKVKSLIFRFAH